jgi:WD40 repeat protein
MSDATLIETRNIHTTRVNDIDTLKDGRLASASNDRCATISNSSSVKTCLVSHQSNVNRVKTINSQYMASGDSHGYVMIWNVLLKQSVNYFRHGNTIYDLEALLDGRLITAADSIYIRIWNILTGTYNQIYTYWYTRFLKLVRSDLFAAAHDDKIIRLYFFSGSLIQLVRKCHGHSSSINGLDFVPSLNLLLSVDSDNKAFIWNMNIPISSTYATRITLEKTPFTIKYLLDEGKFN